MPRHTSRSCLSSQGMSSSGAAGSNPGRPIACWSGRGHRTAFTAPARRRAGRQHRHDQGRALAATQPARILHVDPDRIAAVQRQDVVDHPLGPDQLEGTPLARQGQRAAASAASRPELPTARARPAIPARCAQRQPGAVPTAANPDSLCAPALAGRSDGPRTAARHPRPSRGAVCGSGGAAGGPATASERSGRHGSGSGGQRRQVPGARGRGHQISRRILAKSSARPQEFVQWRAPDGMAARRALQVKAQTAARRVPRRRRCIRRSSRVRRRMVSRNASGNCRAERRCSARPAARAPVRAAGREPPGSARLAPGRKGCAARALGIDDLPDARRPPSWQTARWPLA